MGKIAAGVDIGATKIAVAYFDCERREFLTKTLREFPSRVQEGPAVVVAAVRGALETVGVEVGVSLADVPVVGLDYPGPARRDGQLSAKGRPIIRTQPGETTIYGMPWSGIWGFPPDISTMGM